MNKVPMQLFDEPDDKGNRNMVALVTTTDEVIVNPSSASPKTLTQKLEEMKPIILSDIKPTYACLWAKKIK